LGPKGEITLGFVAELGVEFMNPAVNRDLVSRVDHRPRFARVDHGRDSRHEEGRLNAMPFENSKNARRAAAPAVLALAQPPEGLATIAEFHSFVIRIEG
jgi:hypothetical protein